MPRGEKTKVFSLKTYRRPRPPSLPRLLCVLSENGTNSHTFPLFRTRYEYDYRKRKPIKGEAPVFPLFFFADPRTLLSIFFLFFSFLCMRVSMTRADANSLSSQQDELRVDFFCQQEQSIMLLLFSSPLPVHWAPENESQEEEKKEECSRTSLVLNGGDDAVFGGESASLLRNKKRIRRETFCFAVWCCIWQFLELRGAIPPPTGFWNEAGGGSRNRISAAERK